jgi:hypothetical protein
MTDNVTVREPEVAKDDSSTDRSNREPLVTDARAEPTAPVTPATPDQVTTADMAAAGGVAPADVPATQPGDEAATPPAVGADRNAGDSRTPSADVKATGAAERSTERETPDPRRAKRGAERDPRGDGDGATEPLFGGDQASDYRSRWQEIQTGFVDEPKAAVQEADALVAEVMRQLARSFADERRGLEGQWAEGEEISTEELRIALRRYRSFFDRLLSV